jgi:hypothetical protein
MAIDQNREGFAELNRGQVEPVEVRDAPYPHIDIDDESGEERNEDTVTPAAEGPLIGTLEPAAESTEIRELSGAAGEAVQFYTDTPFGDVVTFSGIPPDMSGASSENIVFLTGNTFAVLSTDEGNTFTALDITKIFPSGPSTDAAGNLTSKSLCCDQVIQYDPEFDLFIWLMQFCGTGATCLQGINKLRIAAASSEAVRDSGGTAWTYWDFFSADFGLAGTMDYPDLSIGNSMLNVSVDAVSERGLLIFRMPLSEIAARGTVNFEFTNPADSVSAYGGHVSQNTGDTVYWAGQLSTSQLRVFSMPEGVGSYSWRDIDINSYPNIDYTSFAPDGTTDWLLFLGGPNLPFPNDAIIGATRRQGPGGSELWLAWSAARGGGFPHPHIQVVELDTQTWGVINQWQIWNPDLAFAYPCLATNSQQEVGISLGWGGGNNFHANHAVGILGDFVVWFSEASDATINRWGDYVTVRRAGRPSLFSGVGYSVLQNAPPAAGTRFNPRYTLFGRP